MIFSSYLFVFLFMPLTLLYYRFLLAIKSQNIVFWLVVTSLIFYSYWNWRNLFILIPSLCFNFYSGRVIGSSNINRKWILILSIAANLLLLGYFKYAYFLINE